ncbi:MATE family efflux transporter [Azospirillum oleiclasticum]|uniref:MATE family efflux transporter n=1 Tax=Azospirillum oleiclasticum TaxID=2735135 RepID=UPI0031B60C53
MIVSRVGLMVMMAVDAAIVGRYGARELAYYGLGHLPASFMVQTGVGLLLGTVAMTAQAVGAGRPEECGKVLRRSLPYALLIGLIMAVLALFGQPLFLATGQAPDMAERGAAVLAVLGAGLPAMALYVALGFFLEGLKRPVPGMLVMIAGNIVNAGLAWALVWGWGPVPAMGAVGSAWATTAVRWFMAIALLLYVWNLRDRERWNVRGGFGGWWREGGAQRRFGYAAGLSLAVESLAFGGLGLIAGLIDPMAVAAYTVTLNLIALPFMAAVGVASATAVRVAVGYGRRDSAEMALAGWTGLGVTSAFLALVGVAYALFPAPIAGIYSADPALIERVAPLVAFSALVLVADGGQTVMGNALRGRNDSWVPTALHFVSYAVVMIPVSAYLALGLERGERGLVEGILVASLVSVTILAGRFAWLCRR